MGNTLNFLAFGLFCCWLLCTQCAQCHRLSSIGSNHGFEDMEDDSGDGSGDGNHEQSIKGGGFSDNRDQTTYANGIPTAERKNASTSRIGGTGGTAFSDQSIYAQNGHITALKMCLKKDINSFTGIQAKYGLTWASLQGGCTGSEINLSFKPNEIITKMDVGAAHNGWHVVICYITVYTNIGTYGPYKASCDIYTSYNLYGGLAYLSGSAGSELDSLTLHYERLIALTPRIGGPGGTAFSDLEYFDSPITALKICLRRDIQKFTGIQVRYGSTWAPVQGGCASSTVINLSFASDEVIIKMDVGSDDNALVETVCYMTIYTNIGTYGPYRACYTNFKTYNLFGGLAYFSGSTETVLNALVLHYDRHIAATPRIGGASGTAFSDQSIYELNGPITALNMCIKESIKSFTGIQATYGSTWPIGHGDCSDKEISLSFKSNEVITKMDIGTLASSGQHIAICYVTVYTNIRTYDIYKGCDTYTTYDLFGGLAYLSGSAGSELDALILNYERQISSTPQVGGTGGSAFSDQSVYFQNSRITALNMCLRDVSKSFTGIQVKYGSTWASRHGDCLGTEINLSFLPDEIITKIDVGATYNGWHMAICYFAVHTTVKTYGPYKGCDSYTTYKFPGGLAYLSGSAGDELDALIFNFYD